MNDQWSERLDALGRMDASKIVMLLLAAYLGTNIYFDRDRTLYERQRDEKQSERIDTIANRQANAIERQAELVEARNEIAQLQANEIQSANRTREKQTQLIEEVIDLLKKQ